jgi:hypothetical protein
MLQLRNSGICDDLGFGGRSGIASESGLFSASKKQATRFFAYSLGSLDWQGLFETKLPADRKC